MASDTNGNGNGNGKMKDWTIKALWSALMIVGGALVGNYTSGSISRAEVTQLVEQGKETHGAFVKIDVDHEGRIRRVEEAVVYLRTLVEERANGNR